MRREACQATADAGASSRCVAAPCLYSARVNRLRVEVAGRSRSFLRTHGRVRQPGNHESRFFACGCRSCSNVGQLRLKVVVHSGETLVYEIAGRTELAGVDVIIVHRLLKNSLASREYLLLTEAAQRNLPLDLPVIETLVEDVEDIGPVRVTAYQP